VNDLHLEFGLASTWLVAVLAATLFPACDAGEIAAFAATSAAIRRVDVSAVTPEAISARVLTPANRLLLRLPVFTREMPPSSAAWQPFLGFVDRSLRGESC